MEPQTPSDDDAHVQPLVDYLEQHRETINVEALRKQLLEAGHPPELVDEALRRIGHNPIRKPWAWPFGLLIVVANLVLVGAIETGLFSISSALSGTVSTLVGWIALGLVPLVLIGEIIAGVRLTNGPHDRLGRALIWGAIFSVITVIMLVILAFGACFMLLSGSFN
ncbi:MAG: hypothetical protein WCP31_10265 [Chloroflexales bacterium]